MKNLICRSSADMVSAILLLLILPFGLLTCGDDEAGTEAQRRGVGAECVTDGDCTEEGQECLTQFKGGYCGIQGCEQDADCPQGSACITHDDQNNYCFLICSNKDQCNLLRSEENEANCSSSVDFVEEADGRKVCVPPSGN
jgi:hypothetical protein